MYNNVLTQLAEKVSVIENEALENIIEEVKERYQTEHKTTLTIISDKYARKYIASMLGVMLGGEEYGVEDGEPCCFVVTYEDGVQGHTVIDDYIISGDETYAYKKVVVKSDNLLFKDVEIAWYYGFNLKYINESILDFCDYVVLFTNATMAMTLDEKNFIRDGLCKKVGGDRLTVSLYNTELLNSKSDFDSVKENVTNILESFDAAIEFVPMAFDLSEKCKFVAENSSVLNDKRCKAMVNNCVEKLLNVCKSLLETTSGDIEELKRAVSSIEAEKNNIQISGKVLVVSMLDNMYDSLKYDICDAANAYNDNIYENIKERITTTDSIEKDIENIEPYFEVAWKQFEEKAAEKISSEHLNMAEKLAEQIEQDCAAMMSGLDMSNTALANCLPDSLAIKKDLLLSQQAAEESVRKQKFISKGILVASIALTFVNPVLGISTLVGAKVFEHFKKKDSVEDLKKEVIDKLGVECTRIKQQVVENVSIELDKMKETDKHNVEEVYVKATNDLVETIVAAVDKMNKAVENRDKIESLVDELAAEFKIA